MGYLDWVSVAASIATVLTVIFLIYQIRMETKATELQTAATKSQVYQNFVTNSMEIDHILIEHPEMRKYVYSDAEIGADVDMDLLMGIEELIVDVVENAEIFRDQIPEDRRIGWDKFIKQVKGSSAYQKYKELGYSEWYDIE